MFCWRNVLCITCNSPQVYLQALIVLPHPLYVCLHKCKSRALFLCEKLQTGYVGDGEGVSLMLAPA